MVCLNERCQNYLTVCNHPVFEVETAGKISREDAVRRSLTS